MRKTQKNSFQLNKGLNTESNEITFPDGYTVDERNYELLFNGARRRRRGLTEETGGSTKTLADALTTTAVARSYVWRGVGGNPDKNFIVHQIGEKLFFTDDATLISTTYHDDFVDLDAFRVLETTTTASIASEPAQFSHGRGHLFVSQKYIIPFYIEYDATNDRFDAVRIDLTVRDFDGIDDALPMQSKPLSLTADHNYNLRNRGWPAADIVLYQTDGDNSTNKYPAKSMHWYRGYRRQTNVVYSDLDGVQVFEYNKSDGEVLSQSSAPQGSLFLNPLDTQFSSSTTNEGQEIAISTWAVQGTATDPRLQATWTARISATGHGRETNDVVQISGNVVKWKHVFGGNTVFYWSLDGSYAITKQGDDAFDITVDRISLFWSDWYPGGGQNFQTGILNGNVALPKSDGVAATQGPTAIAYHAGRVWYAGIAEKEWSDTIFFSKIAQRAIGYSRCYQENDPTDPDFNSLSSSDGGTIVIPNLGNVKRMLTYGSGLLIFSDQGVWEIGGGQRGLFTAKAYSVNKITEDECSSSYSPVVIGDRVIYTGPRGIHQIQPNEFTGATESVNISEQLVQTLWNDIPSANQKVVQTVYDSARKRVYFLYGDTGDSINVYANALVYDLRLKAFYKFAFNVTATAGPMTAYAITDADSSESNQKVKWLCMLTTTTVDMCDMNQSAYLDYDGAEAPLPYMITGWDNLGDFQRRRQTPIITVFSKRTLTGFSAAGSGLDADNDSSTLMTAMWDWTEDPASANITGKTGSQNEVYRAPRAFQPSGVGTLVAVPANDDGYPVYTTRNKVRGRGRVLQLRFDGAATKDSHLLGFSTNYELQEAA